MDNKLSELSKPVAEIRKYYPLGIDSPAGVFFQPMDGLSAVNFGDFLYSQEYVSALQHESAVNWEAAASLNVENQEMKKRIAELEEQSNQLKKELHNEGAANAHAYERIRGLEKRLASPVRLKKVDSSNVPFAGDGFNAAVDYCAKAIRAAGFKVEGDE